MKPQRLYVIVGDPLWTLDTDMGVPEDQYDAPGYSTDPRDYDLDLFVEPVSDEQFDREYKQKCRAFLVRDDAVTFAYHCNLVSVICPVYDLVDGEWVQNDTETGNVADRIN